MLSNVPSLRSFVGRETTFSVANQVLVSGLNFAVGIVAARVLGVADFGLFALILLMSNLTGTCLQYVITVPMMTLAGSRARRSRAYFAAVVRLGILGAAVSGLAIAVFVIALYAARSGTAESGLVLSAAFVTFAQNLQIVVRRVLFAQRRLRQAVLLDLSRLVLIAVHVALLGAGDGEVDVQTALDVLALSALLSAAPFLLLPLTTRLRRGMTVVVLVRHWPISSWLLLMMLVSIGQEHALWLISSVEYGDEATGALRAGQYLLGVTHFLMLALENFLPKRAAEEMCGSGVAGLRRYLFGQMLFVGAASLALIVPTAIFAEPLLSIVFGAEYGAYGELTRIFAAIYAVTVIRAIWLYYLRVVERTRDVFMCYAASSAVALVVVYPMMAWAGVNGIALTMLIAQVVLLTAVLLAVVRHGTSLGQGHENRPLSRHGHQLKERLP